MKYKVDEWILYCPIPDAKSEILSSERLRAVILSILTTDPFYDYEIFIEESGKIKKVREHHLFPEPLSTY